MSKQDLKTTSIILLLAALWTSRVVAQQVEVQGKLKVTQMTGDDTVENLVIRNTDGTLGTRTVSSLPPPPPPIDTTRNLASDYELARHLCDCPNLPPFMIKKLLESGYTEGDLAGAGVPEQDIIDAIRFGSFRDTRDNQFYKTVTIGSQTWMAENLNIGTMIDGTSDQMNNSVIEKYCYNNDAANCTTYGGLYQWDEAMQYSTIESSQGICPTGWHLPSDDEFKTLEMALGMTQAEADMTDYRGTDQGSQLAGNDLLWTDDLLEQNAAFGSSGFEGLPGGLRLTSGGFLNLSLGAYFWSSTDSGTDAGARLLSYDFTKVFRYVDNKVSGMSVRCVQD